MIKANTRTCHFSDTLFVYYASLTNQSNACNHALKTEVNLDNSSDQSQLSKADKTPLSGMYQSDQHQFRPENKNETTQALTQQTGDLRQNPTDWLKALDSQAPRSDLATLGFPAPKIEGEPIQDKPLAKVPGDRAEPASHELVEFKTSWGQSFFVGNKIQLDITPGKYTAQKDKPLSEIARERLPQNASEADLKSYAVELKRLNLSRVAKQENGTEVAKAGETLVLPGHNKDGAVLFEDSRGTRYSYTQDGKMTLTNKDGTGYHRSYEGTGEDFRIKQQNFGPKLEDNFKVVFGKHDRIIENTKLDSPPRSLPNERAKLESLADKSLPIDKERTAFKQNMQAFEQRAKRDHLSSEEVAKTYRDLSNILSTRGDTPMTERERARLVTQTLRAIANPKSNDQGAYGTCQTAIIENRVLAEEPSKATAILSQIAKDGKFTAMDGTRVEMDATNLRAHGQSAFNIADSKNVRTYASQVLEMAIRNAYLTRSNQSSVPPEEMRLLQQDDPRQFDHRGQLVGGGGGGGGAGGGYDNAIKFEPGKQDNAQDGQLEDLSLQEPAQEQDGLRQWDYRTNPPTEMPDEKVDRSFYMSLRGYQQVTGKFSPERQVSYSPYTDDNMQQMFGKQINSEESLTQYLTQLRASSRGDLYAFVHVAGDAPVLSFPGQDGGSSGGGSSGRRSGGVDGDITDKGSGTKGERTNSDGTDKTVLENSDKMTPQKAPEQPAKQLPSHALNIIDYDPKTGLVKLDNQWGNSADKLQKPVHVSELYKSMVMVRK